MFLGLLDPDPDPGPIVRGYGSGSGSGSFYREAKIVRKTLISTVLCLLFYFFSVYTYPPPRKELSLKSCGAAKWWCCGFAVSAVSWSFFLLLDACLI